MLHRSTNRFRWEDVPARCDKQNEFLRALQEDAKGRALPILHYWSDISEEAVSPDVAKRRLGGRGAELVRVSIKAGTNAARHSHPHEQFVQVLAGHGMLETEEGHQAFSAGSVFHFPAETWHAARFDEDTILVEVNLARQWR